MTLPSSGPITMAQVAAELGISASGLSLDDSRVRTLAARPAGAISFADLLGKSWFNPFTSVTGGSRTYASAPTSATYMYTRSSGDDRFANIYVGYLTDTQQAYITMYQNTSKYPNSLASTRYGSLVAFKLFGVIYRNTIQYSYSPASSKMSALGTWQMFGLPKSVFDAAAANGTAILEIE